MEISLKANESNRETLSGHLHTILMIEYQTREYQGSSRLVRSTAVYKSETHRPGQIRPDQERECSLDQIAKGSFGLSNIKKSRLLITDALFSGK